MSTEICAKLKKLSLFSEFNDNELEGILGLVDVVKYPAGQCIVKQDDSGNCMFVLTEGSAKVSHRAGGHTFELAMLQPGDFFGELAIVDAGPRSADVETVTECMMLKVEHGALRALAGVYPNAAFKFLIAVGRVLVTRLRRGNQKYIDSLLAARGVQRAE